ncbi:hypothetical protein N8760_02745 [Rhodobacteraceae bacterium]|nr:hypothetical protein [Paracoccaceae bacterium]
MQAWNLLRHSFVMLFGNFAIALRLSAVLYAVQAIPNIYFLNFTSGVADAELGSSPQFWLFGSVNMVILMITGLWVAVAWHRFILSEEIPSGYIPITIFLAFPLFGDLSQTYLTYIFYLLISMLCGPILFRFSTVLPAAALGKRFTWGAAWQATKGSIGSLVLVALVLWGGLMGANEHVTNLISGNLFLLALWAILFEWVFLMIHISILTTLYGHYVEKRALV